jgi:hypothetical protein
MAHELPPPDRPDDADSTQSQHSRRQAEETQIPTPDEILRQLVHINSMVLMGVSSIPKARVILQNLQIQLKAQTQRPEGENLREPSMEALAELLRKDPTFINLLEGILSDAHIACLLRHNPDAPH